MTVSSTLVRRPPFSRSRVGAIVSAVALVALSAGWVGGGTALAVPAGPQVPPVGVTVDKVDICHSTGALGNPYVTNTSVNVSSIVPAPTGHTSGNDGIIALFPAAAWGDIIPPFQWDNAGVITQFPGQNWIGAGQFYFSNNCDAVHVAAVTPTITASTCTLRVPSLPSFTIPNTPGLSYFVDGAPVNAGDVITGVSTTKVLTAVAQVGFVLTNAPFSVDMVFGALANCATPVTFASPTLHQSVCVGNAASVPTFDLNRITGLIYTLAGGGVIAGNTVNGVAGAIIIVNIAADTANGYVLAPGSPTFFSVTFAAAPNCAPVIVTPGVTVNPDLSIDKAGPTGAVKPGDNVPYTLTVKNFSNATISATNVQVNDALPAAMTLVSVSGTGWTCTGTTSVNCQLAGGLAPGASSVLNLVATLASGYNSTSVANTATVLPTDANPSNNTDTETTAVTLPTPPVDEDLGISKTGLVGSVFPGDVLSWTVAVTNVAGNPATGFTVTDVLPDGLSLLSVGGAEWVCGNAGQTITCTYTGDPLPTGSSSGFQIDSLVGADYTGTTVTNTAVVDPGGVDASNDSATAVTPVVFTGGGGGTVVEPEPTPEPTGGEALPFTGSYTDRMLSGGVTVLLLGLFLAIAGRRRRTS